MANIGKLTVQSDGTYKGEFHTLKQQFPLRMIPCDRASDKHPVYRVYPGKTEIGAATAPATTNAHPSSRLQQSDQAARRYPASDLHVER